MQSNASQTTYDQMTEELIDDLAWQLLKPLLFKIRNTQGPSKRQDDREFLNAIAYLAQTGKPWRDLPERYGNWHSVYMRFRRWEQARTWAELGLEMDDRAHLVFKRVFFENDGDAEICPCKKYLGVKYRLRKAIFKSINGIEIGSMTLNEKPLIFGSRIAQTIQPSQN